MPDAGGPLRLEPGVWPVLSAGDGRVAVRGADHLEQTQRGLLVHRLPDRALRRIHAEFFRVVERQPSGVRLVLQTAATELELDISTTALAFFPDEPVASYGRVDLVIDGRVESQFVVPAGGLRTMDVFANTSTVAPGPTVTVRFDGLPPREKTVELWLPHDVEVGLESIRADAPFTAPSDPRPVCVVYGSSITHGANARRPTDAWPAVATAAAGMNLVSLGFSGSAMLDSSVAATIRDRPADVIVLKIGINVINHDGFRTRTFVPAVHAFLDTIREGHPTTPIWVVSAILCPIVEDRPGPTMLLGEPGARYAATAGLPEEVERGRLSLGLTRDILELIVASRGDEDPNLHYLDGRALYGEAENESMPMRDGLHPDTAAQRHIGARVAELVLGVAAAEPEAVAEPRPAAGGAE
jgi:hypothetical protein